MLHAFYETYYKELYLYIYGMCRQQEMAEDILQETFLKAFTSLKDSHTNIRAWLYMVARNLYFNYSRKEKRFVLTETESKREDSPREDVLEQMIQEETRQVLWKALKQLAVPKREVILLQYFGGFSQKQIAAMMRLSLENVRVLAYRARKELKEYMEVDGYDLS